MQSEKKEAKTTFSTTCDNSEGSTSIETCYSSDQFTLANESPSSQLVAEGMENSLFEALDRVGRESDDYWDKMAEEKIREFDSYRDTYPCILTDKERTVTVYVDGTGKYKGTSALKCVEIKEYLDRMMKKEEKATELCRAMWDRVETLEGALKDSKVKMLQMH